MEKLSIPKYRQQFIDKRIYAYIKRYEIKSWPIDSIKLLGRMIDYGRPNISVMLGEGLHEDADACTIYSKKSRTYQIIFNKERFKYPFEKSSDRRTNFTAAHEIGHIALDHLNVSSKHKTKKEILLEDLEADEFAGRLLMPKALIFSCNYYSIDDVAAYMKVSTTALKRRLVNLARTDIMHLPKVKCCQQCGNKKFSMFGRFCMICGRDTSLGLDGIRRVNYRKSIAMDRYKRAISCPSCMIDLKGNQRERCSNCGSYIFNFCTSYFDGKGDCSFANMGNARYCEMCGDTTYYFDRGFLKPWQEQDLAI